HRRWYAAGESVLRAHAGRATAGGADQPGEPQMIRAILAIALLAGCSSIGDEKFGKQEAPPNDQVPACAPARPTQKTPLLRTAAGGSVTVTFDELKSRINERCARCHLDTTTGGFHYMADYNGLSQSAELMDMLILVGRMPPNDSDPEGSKLLGLVLQ